MPDTDRRELIDDLVREVVAGPGERPAVAVLVVAAVLAASTPDLLAAAMQAATRTADRQFVAIAAAHLAGDHDRVAVLASDHLADHAPMPVLTWIVDHSRATTHDQGAPR